MNTNATQHEMPASPAPVDNAEPTPAPSGSPVASPPQQPMQQPVQQPASQGVSEDTKTLITVLLLIFVFPIGLIVMFFWPKWKWWVKLLIALPLLLFVPLFLAFVLIAVNPAEQIEKAECVTACEESGGTDCVEMCSVPEESIEMDTTTTEPILVE